MFFRRKNIVKILKEFYSLISSANLSASQKNLKGRLALRTTLTGRPEGSSHPATSGGLRGMLKKTFDAPFTCALTPWGQPSLFTSRGALTGPGPVGSRAVDKTTKLSSRATKLPMTLGLVNKPGFTSRPVKAIREGDPWGRPSRGEGGNKVVLSVNFEHNQFYL